MRKQREGRKPCIGLCHIAKMKKTSTARSELREETVEDEQEEVVSDEPGYKLVFIEKIIE